MAAKKQTMRRKAAAKSPAKSPAKSAKAKSAKKQPAKRPDSKAHAAPSSASRPRRSPYVEEIIAHALALPEAWEDHPWGEIVAKVGKKVFVFFGVQETFGMAVKLPASGPSLLQETFAEPCGYGLGKAGWVVIKLDAKTVPLDRAKAWIEESYLAVAPKKLALAWATGS